MRRSPHDELLMNSCFISAPVNLDLSVLRSVLLERGIETVLPFELEITGADFRDQVETAIEKADFFIGVLSGRSSNANVFFELGLAWAKRKRVLLVQGRELDLPSSLAGFPIFMGKIEEPGQVAGFLDEFLKRHPASSSLTHTVEKTKPLSERANELVSHLEALGPRATEAEFSKILTTVFRESGIQVVAESDSTERGYDLALWLDELEYLIGNPVLVELRRQLTPALARVIKQKFLTGYRAAVGKSLLVIYVGGPEKQLSKISIGAPLVLFVSAARLLTNLRTQSIASFIRTERNKLAHGV